MYIPVICGVYIYIRFCPTLCPSATECAPILSMQVRLAVDRNTDLALFGGRCEVLIRYDVGFDDDGHIQAVDMACITMVGVSV